MSKGSYLTELRKRAGFTQQALAKKIGLKASYGQKKISQWEADLAEPNRQEIEKLAPLLGVSREELSLFLSSRTSQSALELFTRLANADHPTLLAVCYSCQPRTFLDPLIRRKYEHALRKNLYLAMFVPFPTYIGEPGSSSSLLLTGYFNRVWGSVLALREQLRREIDDASFDRHLAIYGPAKEASIQDVFVPPFASRYSLLLEKEKSSHNYKKSLYLAVETAERKDLQLIGTTDEESVYEQIQNWEAYFAGVVAAWSKSNALPTGECGYWRYHGR